MSSLPPAKGAKEPPPRTPDGRYFVVRGRLWRLSDPALPAGRRETLVSELMAARRAVRAARDDATAMAAARTRVDAAKQALGERGPPWWHDGAPDYNRKMAHLTPYADWYAAWDATRAPRQVETAEPETSG